MDSSDNDDMFEIESSTDSEGNLNSEKQSKAENSNNSPIVTIDISENEANESEQETLKGYEQANKVSEESG